MIASQYARLCYGIGGGGVINPSCYITVAIHPASSFLLKFDLETQSLFLFCTAEVLKQFVIIILNDYCKYSDLPCCCT